MSNQKFTKQKKELHAALPVIVTSLIFILAIGILDYFGFTFPKSDPEYEEVTPISFAALTPEKRVTSVEMLDSSSASGGQLRGVALVTYKNGKQEKCTFRMVLEPAGDGVNVTPQSRMCQPATEAH